MYWPAMNSMPLIEAAIRALCPQPVRDNTNLK